MVLISREIVFHPVDPTVNDEQKGFLTVLDQVAELAKTAHEIFTNLALETSNTFQRVTKLSKQVANTTSLVSSVEARTKQQQLEVVLKNARTQWTAQINEKSQLFVAAEKPAVIEVLRSKALPPPALQKLDHLTDKPALSFYTNPNFFLDEWVAEQLRQREEAKKARRERRRQRAEKKKEEGPKEAPVEVTKLKITKYDPVTGEKILVDAPAAKGFSAIALNSQPAFSFKRKDSTLDLESPPLDVPQTYRDAPEVPQEVRDY